MLLRIISFIIFVGPGAQSSGSSADIIWMDNLVVKEKVNGQVNGMPRIFHWWKTEGPKIEAESRERARVHGEGVAIKPLLTSSGSGGAL